MPEAVDYDAPDPSRDSLRFVRSFANLTFGNYVMFQIDWFRGVDWIYDTRLGSAIRLP